jgi:hypothetical protein
VTQWAALISIAGVLPMPGDQGPPYGDYQSLAAAHAEKCRERRAQEVHQQAELDELRKARAAQAKPPGDIVNRDGVGGLVYKSKSDALVSEPPAARIPPIDDPNDLLANVSRAAASYADHTVGAGDWRDWTSRNLEYRQNFMRDILGMREAVRVKEMRAHVAAEVETFKRELFVLREELRLEREVCAMHDEIAAARAEVPKLPAIAARVEAKQAKLVAEQARLERELAKTKERLSKLHVDQSTADFKLRQHIKESGPGVELRFTTPESTFRVRDIHPQAAEAWREFCRELLTEQENKGASLRIVDRDSHVNHIVELPVWKSNAV